MLDLDAVIIVIVTWVVVRELIRRWVASRDEDIPPRQAAIAYSVALAIAPLLLLPWRHSEGDIIFLMFAAVCIFLGKYAYINYALSR